MNNREWLEKIQWTWKDTVRVGIETAVVITLVGVISLLVIVAFH